MRLVIVCGGLPALWECASRPAPYMGSPSRDQMITDFDLVLDPRQHALFGEFDDFRSVADDLSQMKAGEAAKAEPIEEASLRMAKIAEACCDCHAAKEIPLGNRFTLCGPPPPGSPAGHMPRLNWASRLHRLISSGPPIARGIRGPGGSRKTVHCPRASRPAATRTRSP